MKIKKLSLVTVLTLVLVTMTTLLLGVFSLISYLSLKNQEQSKLSNSLTFISEQLSSSLMLPVWNFDYPQIQKIVEIQMRNNNITAIEVTVDGKSFVMCRDAEWRAVKRNSFHPSSDLLMQIKNIVAEEEKIGTVKVFVTSRFMQHDLEVAKWEMIIGIVLLDIVLVLSVYVMLWRIVLNPLRKIEDYALTINTISENQKPLDKFHFYGELENLRSSVEKMKALLDARYQELENINLSLQREMEERIEKEESLRENREILRNIIDTIPQTVFWKDKNLQYLGCNLAFAKQAGLVGVEDVIGKTDYDLPWPKDEAEAYRSDDREVLQSGQPKLHILEPLQQSDGKRIWIDTSKTPLFDNENNVSGVLGVYEDVTLRKEMEKKLSDSELKFRTLFNNASDAIFIMDNETIIDCNTSTLEMFGCNTADQIIGRSPMEFSPEQQLNGLNSFELGQEKIAAALSGQKQFFEWSHKKLDGTLFTTEVSLNKVEIGGKALLQAIVRDITERKKSEEQIQMLKKSIDSHYDGAYWMDTENNIVYVNDAGCSALGYTREELINKNICNINPNATPEGMEFVWKKLRTDGYFFGETFNQRKDGGTIPVEIMTTYIQFEGREYNCGFARDITERKQAEEKLRESEERYRKMIQILPDGVAIITEGKVEYLNDNASKILKVKQVEEIIGTFALEHVHPDFRDIGQKRLAEVMANKSTAETMEMKYLTRDGKAIDVQTAAAYFNYKGKPSVLVVFTDVSERKQAEAALKDSESRYRYLFKQNPLPMLIYELGSLQILAVNDAFVSRYGYSEAEAARLYLYDLYPEAEKKPIIDLTEILQGHAYAGEWHHIKKDKTQIIIEAYSHGINYDDRQARIAVINDITVRKQAEEELLRYKDHLVEMVEERTSELEESRETFRALAENTKDVIARVNEKMEFLYVNSAMKDVFDIPIDNYLGKTLAELNFPQNLVLGLERIIKNVFESKQNLHTEFQLQNGIWADLIAMPEFDINDNVISVIISARDITKLKTLQQEIQESLEKEKELNQLKNRFISMVSHEYRTPLTSILSSIEILEMGEEKYTKEKKKVHYNRIQKNIDFMIDMIDEVLYVNRIDSNRVEIFLQKTDLSKFCADLLDEIKELYPEIKSTIKINLEEREYRIDEAIMKKILVNLITNAYKYNKQDGEVSFIIKSEKDKLIFDISDTGIGIPEDEQKNVFEPFSRMTNTQNVKGTGLGLSIVKKSVEQLGGTVSFTSRKDEGSTFKVILPIN